MAIMKAWPSPGDRWDYIPSVPALDIVIILEEITKRLRAECVWKKMCAAFSALEVGETRALDFEEPLVAADFNERVDFSGEFQLFHFEILPTSMRVTRLE